MKVLVIDDEPLVRRALGKALRLRGHEVFEAEDGEAGLTQWQSVDPDLVFVDVLMPKKSGTEVISEIGKGRRAKVILMSAFAGGHNVEQTQSIGADLFLAKPFENVIEIVKIAEDLK